MPHHTGHVILDVAVLGLVQADTEAVGELCVAPHGRRPVLLLADLTPVLAAVAQVVAVHAGALDVFAFEVFSSSSSF